MKNLKKMSNYELGELINYYAGLVKVCEQYSHVTEDNTSDLSVFNGEIDKLNDEIERRFDKGIRK